MSIHILLECNFFLVRHDAVQEKKIKFLKYLTAQCKTKNYFKYQGSQFITVHSLDNFSPSFQ
jgi:hypothetical protein